MYAIISGSIGRAGLSSNDRAMPRSLAAVSLGSACSIP